MATAKKNKTKGWEGKPSVMRDALLEKLGDYDFVEKQSDGTEWVAWATHETNENTSFQLILYKAGYMNLIKQISREDEDENEEITLVEEHITSTKIDDIDDFVEIFNYYKTFEK